MLSGGLGNIVGVDFNASNPISLDNTGAGSTSNFIQAQEVDVYDFQATVTGRISLIVNPLVESTFFGQVDVNANVQEMEAYDGDQNPIATSSTSTLTINVVQGENYYVALNVSPGSLTQLGYGGYELDLATYDQIPLDVNGSGNQAGSISGPTDTGLYYFTAAVTGQFSAQLNAPAGSSLDPTQTQVDVFDSSFSQLNTTETADPQVSVMAGQTYYLQVGSTSSTGPYELSLSTIQSLIVPVSGTTESGAILVPGGANTYRFAALATGQITIEQDAAAGSSLDSYLSVADPSGKVIATNDDLAPTGTLNSRVTFPVVANNIYVVHSGSAPKAAHGPHSVGSFTLEFSAILQQEQKPDATRQDSNLVSFGSPFAGSTTSGEVAFYAVNVNTAGYLTAQVHAPSAAVRLELRDDSGDLTKSTGVLIAQSDGISASSPDDLIQLHVSAGVYFLEIAGIGAPGSYTLSTSMTDSAPPLVGQGGSAYVLTNFTAYPNGDEFPNLIVTNFRLPGEVFPDLVEGDGLHPGLGDGTFQSSPIPVDFGDGLTPLFLVSGDFLGNGHPGLGVISKDVNGQNYVSVLLEQSSDGFGSSLTLPISTQATSIAVGAFDGQTDLVVGESDGDIDVFRFHKDGTFDEKTTHTNLTVPAQLIAADFNGDKKLDLAVKSEGAGVAVLLGNGDGIFHAPVALGQASYVGVGHFVAGDTRPDLVLLGNNSTTLSVIEDLAGKFQHLTDTTVDAGRNFAIGDFNGDGVDDVAMIPTDTLQVTTYSGDGKGGFDSNPVLSVAQLSGTPLLATDLNGDGRSDLLVQGLYAATTATSSGLYAFLGNGDGTFQSQGAPPTGTGEYFPVPGQFTRSGQSDLAVVEQASNDIYTFINNGDGTFRDGSRLPTGEAPQFPVVADINNDGRADVALVDAGDLNLVNLLFEITSGQTTTKSLMTPSGMALLAKYGTYDLSTGLFNLNKSKNSGVSILLGKGDGIFAYPTSATPGDKTKPIDAGFDPQLVEAGDFGFDATGNKNLDLVVGGIDSIYLDPNGISSNNYLLANFSILYGNEDGTFSKPVPLIPGMADLKVGINFQLLATGDFDGTGGSEVAILDNVGKVHVYQEVKDKQWAQVGVTDTLEPNASTIISGDFAGQTAANHQDVDDLAVYDGTNIRLLKSFKNGKFAVQAAIPTNLDTGYEGATVAAYNIRQKPGLNDLIAFNGSPTVDILFNNGKGGLEPANKFTVNSTLRTQLGTVLDQASADIYANAVEELYGLEGLSNQDGVAAIVNSQDAPVTFTDPATARKYVASVDSNGSILLRQINQDGTGTLGSPVILNIGIPSRSITLVAGPAGGDVMLASVDAGDSKVSVFDVSEFVANGMTIGTAKILQLASGTLPSQILSADLNGDQKKDLIVRNAGDGTTSTVAVFLADGKGGFLPEIIITVAGGASDMALTVDRQTKRLDIVLTEEINGEVLVLINEGNGKFSAPQAYQGGTGAVSFDEDSSILTSLDQSSNVAAATLTAGGTPTLIVANPGTETIGLLRELGTARFDNPIALPTPDPVEAIVAGDFAANGVDEVAVLEAGNVAIYTANGKGGLLTDAKGQLVPKQNLFVGNDPTGLSISDVNGDGKLDLLVGNAQGDVEVLYGLGNGTFQEHDPLDQSVVLAVGTIQGNDGKPVTVTVVANQQTDTVKSSAAADPTSVTTPTNSVASQFTGLELPKSMQIGDLNGPNNLPYLIVVDSSANRVLVYPINKNGSIGPEINGGKGFATGTTPVAVSLADLTGDGRMDLIVSNYGSNDVSILLNTLQPDGTITFTEGIRVQAGSGPVAAAVSGVPGTKTQQLKITNSLSNNVEVVPSRGGGFFDDQHPTFIDVAPDPIALIPELPTSATGGSAGDTATDIALGKGTLSVINQGSTTAIEVTVLNGLSDPIASVTFDEQAGGGGFSGVIVANAGLSDVTIIEDGAGGLVIAPDLSIFNPSGSSSLTSLSDAEFANGVLSFYAGFAGEGSAYFEQIDFLAKKDTTPTSSPSPALEQTGGETGQEGTTSSGSTPPPEQAPTLTASTAGALPLIGTLLTITATPGPSTSNESESESTVQTATQIVTFLTTTSGGSSQSARSEEQGGSASAEATGSPGQASVAPTQAVPLTLGIGSVVPEEGDEVAANLPVQDDPGVPGSASWQRYFLGPDNSMEDLRNQLLDSIQRELPASKPDAPVSPSSESTTELAPRIEVGGRMAAIDEAIREWNLPSSSASSKPTDEALSRFQWSRSSVDLMGSKVYLPGVRIGLPMSFLTTTLCSGQFFSDPRRWGNRRNAIELALAPKPSPKG